MIMNPTVIGTGDMTAEIFVTGLSETDTVTCTKDGKVKQGKWVTKTNPAVSVPAEYTQLEYIESSGIQYIDTGISAQDGFKAVIDWEFKTLNEFANIIGAGGENSSTYNFLCIGSPNDYFWQLGAGNYKNSSVKVMANTRYNIDISTVTGYSYLKIGDVTLITSETTNARSGGKLFIFALNNGVAKYFSSAKMYSCKIINNDSVVRDYIPAKRNSDGAVGLYDLISKTFFTNAGTGTFTAGTEIPSTTNGWLFDKLKSYGTYTITATNGTNTATQDVLVDMATQYDIEMSYRRLYLYNLGDECKSVTGGWFKNYYGNGSSGTAQKNDRSMTVRGANNSNGAECGVMTKNSIDFSKYTLLNVEVNNLTNTTIGSIVVELRSSKEIPLNGTRYLNNIIKSNGITMIDISSTNNICYIDLLGYYNSRGGDIYKVWLE